MKQQLVVITFTLSRAVSLPFYQELSREMPAAVRVEASLNLNHFSRTLKIDTIFDFQWEKQQSLRCFSGEHCLLQADALLPLSPRDRIPSAVCRVVPTEHRV